MDSETKKRFDKIERDLEDLKRKIKNLESDTGELESKRYWADLNQK